VLIVDDTGEPILHPDAGGYLVVRKPWPAMLRTIWGDNERYLQTYWEKFHNRYYVAGDSAHRDADGCYWIMGRIDDVLKVSGHRLGTMEIESALVAHPRVAEAAVVGRPHDVKGESVFAFVVFRGARPTGEITALVAELRNWVGEQLGPIAKPDDIRFADNLPKTRSGKIMRRLLRAIASGEAITQDVSTLENPAIVDQLRGIESALPAKRAPRAPRAPRKPAARQSARRTPAPRKPKRRKQAAAVKLKSGSAKLAKPKSVKAKPTKVKSVKARPVKAKSAKAKPRKAAPAKAKRGKPAARKRRR